MPKSTHPGKLTEQATGLFQAPDDGTQRLRAAVVWEGVAGIRSGVTVIDGRSAATNASGMTSARTGASRTPASRGLFPDADRG